MNLPGCGPDCPCQHPRACGRPWVVFSTGERVWLVELRLSYLARARGRAWRWFIWAAA